MVLRQVSTHILLVSFLSTPMVTFANSSSLNISGPDKIAYSELVQLAQNPKISPTLSKKVSRLLNTPFIYRNSQAAPPTLVTHPSTGPSLRIAAWNIERGFHAEEIANQILTHSSPTTPQTEENLMEDVPDDNNPSGEDDNLQESQSTQEQTRQNEVINDRTDEGIFTGKETPAEEQGPDQHPLKGQVGKQENTSSRKKLKSTPEDAWKWLAQSQVLFLSEVDNGMGRTNYRDVTAELAEKLHMNAAYGVEFLELAPLSKQMQAYAKTHGNKIQVAGEDFNVDATRYKGMHGSAILSRYPILKVQMIRLPDCYNWLKGEQAKLTQLEKVRRSVADKIFQEVMLTEVRKGGRMAMAVDLSIPELPEKKATFVVAHLENRCKSDCRQKQMSFLLNALKNRHNPVVIGGDFNTSGADASPTSVKKEIRDRIHDPSFWTRQAVSLMVPFGYIVNVGATVSKYTKNFHNPATPNIPLVLPNPEYQLFKTLKTFQFEDGHRFDLRGESDYAFKRKGFMANSNQRSIKGFMPTFEFERPLLKGFLGTYKLDWFLVKGYQNQEALKASKTPELFSPTYARTLREINKAQRKEQVKEEESKTSYQRLSDHDPITVDLLLSKPTKATP